MKKELNAFAQLYALIVENPEVTIVEKNYCLRGEEDSNDSACSRSKSKRYC